MRLNHANIQIEPNEPFKYCKLGRAKYAEILTKIIYGYSDGFVLSLNSEWGTGKTTFIQMWRQYLKNQENTVLYFNAWETDFETNPLAAILAEFKAILNVKDNTKFKSLAKKAALVSKSVIPSLIKSVFEKYVDTATITESIKNISDSAFEIFQEEINEYASRKKGISEFREDLGLFIQENYENKPVIFIIDELDRCRPSYAVEVLETIKHFFDVKGIVFVLSIDKIQFANSIKGYYGSDCINGIEYLRRFIDLEFNLPTPKGIDFSNYLYSYYKFDDFFSNRIRTSIEVLRRDGREFIEFTAIVFNKAHLNLRQQEKLFIHSRIGLKQFSEQEYVFPQLYYLLIYLKEYKPDIYRNIKNRKYSLQDLVDAIEDVLLEFVDSNIKILLIEIESLILLFYSTYYREENINAELVEKDHEMKSKLTVKTKFESAQILNYFEHFRRINNISIDLFLKRIDLTEMVIS
ncbi:MAG: hypothetical protein JST86_19150 [Bacteroidetes bacterium]|nr:hypothetical protein [Bacteroidota bacterium]